VLSKSHALLRYTRKCNFIYAHNTSAGFPASILTTYTNAQQHYVKFILEQAMKTQQEVENFSTLSLTAVLAGVGGYCHAPDALPPGIARFPLYRRLGWPQGPIWTRAENLASIGIRCPDRPARSESLYRLLCLDPSLICSYFVPNFISIEQKMGKVRLAFQYGRKKSMAFAAQMLSKQTLARRCCLET
jgi:hypothetical protein